MLQEKYVFLISAFNISHNTDNIENINLWTQDPKENTLVQTIQSNNLYRILYIHIENHIIWNSLPLKDYLIDNKKELKLINNLVVINAMRRAGVG